MYKKFHRGSSEQDKLEAVRQRGKCLSDTVVVPAGGTSTLRAMGWAGVGGQAEHSSQLADVRERGGSGFWA